MNETEPFAPHIEGLAYSQCDDADTVVDYPDDRMATFIWVASAAALVLALTLVITLAHTLSERTQIAGVPGSPPITVTKLPATPSWSSPVSPPVSPPRVSHANPDAAFSASWNEQMPAYPFPDDKCVEYGRQLGCWLELHSVDPFDPQFTFMGRGRCDYIHDHHHDMVGAAQELRVRYSDLTLDQSHEIVRLAIAAYCPQYK